MAPTPTVPAGRTAAPTTRAPLTVAGSAAAGDNTGDAISVPEGWTPFVNAAPDLGEQPEELAFADDDTAVDEDQADEATGSAGTTEGDDAIIQTETAAAPVVEADPSTPTLALSVLVGLLLLLGGAGAIAATASGRTGPRKK